MSVSKELIAASARPLLLSILSQGESYGYAIMQRVHELSDGKIEWKDGMLYPILHRLEQEGLIVSKWKNSETGRKRKYYRLKNSGKKALQEERERWMWVNQTLDRVWEKAPCST